MLGIDFTYLSKIENERLDCSDYPSVGLICKIARVLGACEDELPPAPTTTAIKPRLTTFLNGAVGAAVGLDGERTAVGPGVAVLIPPGVRHRAAGRMTILNVVVPPFVASDEWFD